MKTNYDEATANKIIARIDTILAKYYVLDSTDFDQQPVITGLSSSLSTDKGVPITLSLGNFLVNDPDNVYPDDFSLTIKSGTNYSVSGDTITPVSCFAGTLSVPVTVFDGIAESNEYIVNIEVRQVSGTDIHTACGEYTWIDGVTYTANNNTATYTLTNAEGCDSVVTLDLTIADTCTNTSVSEISNNDVRVYPNPVQDYLVVELPSKTYQSIEILELSGKTIRYVDVLNQNSVVLDMKLKSGMYLMRIVSKDKTQLTRLLVKE